MKFTEYLKQEHPLLVNLNFFHEDLIKIIEDYANFEKVTDGTRVLQEQQKSNDFLMQPATVEPKVCVDIENAMCRYCGKYGEISLGFMDDKKLFTCQYCLPF